MPARMPRPKHTTSSPTPWPGACAPAIDIITTLKGLDFAEAYAQASDTVVEGLTVRLIHYQHLLQAKRAAGLPRDQNDLDNLRRP